MEDLLRAIERLWLRKIEAAKRDRAERFDKVDNQIRRYYKTRNRFLAIPTGDSDPEEENFPNSRAYHKVASGKVGEWVRVMLPFLHYKAPNRLVSPRRPQIPNELRAMLMQQAMGPMGMMMPPGPLPPDPIDIRNQFQSILLSHTLNYTAEDATFDLRGEGRRAVQDALLSGRGVCWHELIETPWGDMPGSFWDDERNLFIDPDAQTLRVAGYTIRRKIRPTWQVAEEFEIEPEKIKGSAKSFGRMAEEDAGFKATVEGLIEGRETMTGDLCVYYEVYSRIGIGQRMVPDDEDLKKLAEILATVGDNVWMTIIPGLGYPANLPPDKVALETPAEIKERLAWPIPTWADQHDPWSFSVLDFYPDGLWPKPPLEDALPLQAFLDYAYSFLMGKVKITCRDIIICSRALGELLKTAIVSGSDQEVVFTDDVDVQGMVEKMVHVLQFNPMNRDIYEVISAVDGKWEQSTGMTELMLAATQTKQMRSSAEAQIKQSNMMIRPNDLADCVEAWHSTMARKEATAQRLIVREGVAPLLGEGFPEEQGGVTGPLTDLWMQHIATDDPYVAAAELTFTVEAGSGRRKNKTKLLADISDSGQIIAPLFMQVYQQTGDPSQINAWLADWALAMDLDPGKYQLPPLQPVAAGTPAQGEPPNGQGQVENGGSVQGPEQQTGQEGGQQS